MKSVLLLLIGCVAAAFGQAAPQVAVLNSPLTREFFSRHYPPCGNGSVFLGADEYQRYFRGWEYVLNINGIPYAELTDADIDDDVLSRYRVLILSNTAALSPEQTKAIKRWVAQGGRLLATFGSGYKSDLPDASEPDLLKLQKGGTFGLHELWGDPMSKLFGSNPVNHGAGTDIRITEYTGPTSCLPGRLPGNILPYGAESNLLIQRPDNTQGVYGFVELKGGVTLRHERPAIIENKFVQGRVLYLAFAPEYLVAKEFNLPYSCPDGQSWVGRSTEARVLMICALRYLLLN